MSITTAAPAVKPITTECEPKLARTPSRASACWTSPAISISASWINSVYPGSVNGLSVVNTTMDSAAKGPDIRCPEQPNSANDGGNDGGIEAVHGQHAGDHCVGNTLRQHDDRVVSPTLTVYPVNWRPHTRNGSSRISAD